MATIDDLLLQLPLLTVYPFLVISGLASMRTLLYHQLPALFP